MKHASLPILITALFVISGCGTYRPYATNPFNPTAKIPHAHPVPADTGKISDSTTFRAGGLALAAASRPIPGTLPYGAGVGIAAAMLLGSGKPKPVNVAEYANYPTALMPVSEAENEKAAQLKMGLLVENAILKSLRPRYQTRIEEYDDTDMFGHKLRPRWLRVNGPYCENWSCQVTGPIPTANALQWEGEMEKIEGHQDGKYYYRYAFSSNKTIGFVKITNEYIKHHFFDGNRHVVEGAEIPGFDYEQFYRHISENLPDWIGYRVVLTDLTKYGYLLTHL